VSGHEFIRADQAIKIAGFSLMSLTFVGWHQFLPLKRAVILKGAFFAP
jgi:hypothetical protein